MQRISLPLLCVIGAWACSSGGSPVPFSEEDAAAIIDAAAIVDAADAGATDALMADALETPPFAFVGMDAAEGEALLHGLMRLSACGGVADLNAAIAERFFTRSLAAARLSLEGLQGVPSPTDPQRLEPLSRAIEIAALPDKLRCVNAAGDCAAIMACLGVRLDTRCQIYEDTGCVGDSVVYCLDTTPRENLLTQDEGHVRFERVCATEGTPNPICDVDPRDGAAGCVAAVGAACEAAPCVGGWSPDCDGGRLRYRDCATLDQVCQDGACALGPNSACAAFPSESHGNHVITCDGDRLIECVHPGLWGDHRDIDCAAFGMRCVREHDALLGVDRIACRGDEPRCDERVDGRFCNGSRVELCVQGARVHVDCAQIGGVCAKNQAQIAACAL
ncbi:hypothetical protein KKF91_11300 [Myxococcota bacterium]|nr:hypothetical protein [Myxococcota bacterium]MBU1431114.1 hypothetical protein [Myxococcota bacterium]MBU1897110.1 hypothetical protein [Myxococcota bacterium]